MLRSPALLTLLAASLCASPSSAGHEEPEVAASSGLSAPRGGQGVGVPGQLDPPPAVVGSAALPLLEASRLTQWMVVLTAFVVKPIYMLLTLLLVVVLWRARQTDLRRLRASLLAFFVGEAACAAEYFISSGQGDGLELVHDIGMVAMFALLPWALFELFDRRLLRLTDPESPCLALRFCGRCWKRERVACGARQLFLVAIPVCALVSLLPLCAPLQKGGIRVPVLGNDVLYASSLFLQRLQFRLLPLVALAAYLIAFALLLSGDRHTQRAALPFFLGFGATGFSLFRFVLGFSFAPMPPWADIWEEVTELLTVAAVAGLLWIFRTQLGLRRESPRVGPLVTATDRPGPQP